MENLRKEGRKVVFPEMDTNPETNSEVIKINLCTLIGSSSLGGKRRQMEPAASVKR